MKTLDDYRLDHLLTVDDFAAYLGITIGTLYRIKRGEEIRLATIKQITRKLKVQPSEVREFADQLQRLRDRREARDNQPIE